MKNDFSGKCAIVTGASSGIGKATATQIAQRGGRVALVDIDIEALNLLKEELNACGQETLAFECDISNGERVREVTAERKCRRFEVRRMINQISQR